MGVLQLKGGNVARLPQHSTGSLVGTMQRSVTATTQASLSAYADSAWLYSTINRLANAVARVDWNLFTTGIDGKLEKTDDIHPAKLLWDNPNEFFSSHELVETVQQHIDLVGEGYIVVARDRDGQGDPAELWPVRPDRITPIPDRRDFIAGYMYKNGSEEIPLPREDVIFLRVPDPNSPYRGLGPVASILNEIDTEKFSSLWNKNFFINGAEPGGIIEFPDGIDDGDFEGMQQRWREQHGGVAQAHRVGIIEKGKWVDRGYTQRDMDFQNLRRLDRDIILGAYGMPSHMLGISENVNRANAEAGEVMFSRWLIVPRLDRWAMGLQRLMKLFPLTNKQYQLKYTDPTPEDRAARLSEAIDLWEAGLGTMNECRHMVGMDDAVLPDGKTPDPAGLERHAAAPAPIVNVAPKPNQGDSSLPGEGTGGEALSYHRRKSSPDKWPVALRKAEDALKAEMELMLHTERAKVLDFVESRYP